MIENHRIPWLVVSNTLVLSNKILISYKFKLVLSVDNLYLGWLSVLLIIVYQIYYQIMKMFIIFQQYNLKFRLILRHLSLEYL